MSKETVNVKYTYVDGREINPFKEFVFFVFPFYKRTYFIAERPGAEKYKRIPDWEFFVQNIIDPNYVYVHDKDDQNGFGGAIITIKTVSGRTLRFKGPYHTVLEQLGIEAKRVPDWKDKLIQNKHHLSRTITRYKIISKMILKELWNPK